MCGLILAAYLNSRAHSFPHLFLTSFDEFTGINQSFGSLMAERNWLLFGTKSILLILFSMIPFLSVVPGVIGAQQHLTARLCATVWIYTC